MSDDTKDKNEAAEERFFKLFVEEYHRQFSKALDFIYDTYNESQMRGQTNDKETTTTNNLTK